MKKTYMKPMLLAEDIETPNANSTCNMHDVNISGIASSCTKPNWINDELSDMWDVGFFTSKCTGGSGNLWENTEFGDICYQASTGTNIIYGS